MKSIFIIPLMLLSMASCGQNNEKILQEEKQLTPKQLTVSHTVKQLVQHKAFNGFGELLLPYDDNSAYYDMPLSSVGRLMPYHGNVRPDVVLDAINQLIDDASSGKNIFYNIYTEAEKHQDASKRNTGIFFFRGKPDAPFAVVCPGGGFAYVGSLHEGFPLAKRISELGYNAFVIRYRIGSERYATEDLAQAIAFIQKNSQALGVGTQHYSLWGGSAGARMVGNIAQNGVSAYIQGNFPKPVTAVIAYTGQSSYSANFPPTFLTVAENDGIANYRVMENRAENLRKAGVTVEFRKYRTAGHGFGLGTGTEAEGWLDLAVKFWEGNL